MPSQPLLISAATAREAMVSHIKQLQKDLDPDMVSDPRWVSDGDVA